MADGVVAVTRIHGIAGRRVHRAGVADHQPSPAFQAYQRALFGLLARPSDMRVNRAPRTVVPEPSGPGDPRGAG
jgi:hypothetical protein